MGDRFQAIVDVEATAGEADALADRMLSWFLETGVLLSYEEVYRNESTLDGLEVATTRTVFYSLDDEPSLSCPRCGWGTTAQRWPAVDEAISRWYEGGPDSLVCQGCGRGAGLNDWRWSPPWGFGYLGFTFWNWPEALSPAFLAEVSARLGHRTVHPYGKL